MQNNDLISRSALWKKFDEAHLFDDGNPRHIAQQIVEEAPAVNAIVLPCNVGDTMWKLCTVNSRIKFGDMWDGKVVETNCDRCGYRNCACYDIGLRRHEYETMIDVIVPKKINSLPFLVQIIPYVGTIWFATREEAEAALAKMG